MAPSPELGQPKAPDKSDTNKLSAEMTNDSVGSTIKDTLKPALQTSTKVRQKNCS